MTRTEGMPAIPERPAMARTPARAGRLAPTRTLGAEGTPSITRMPARKETPATVPATAEMTATVRDASKEGHL
jgi:hypothetical protein